MPAVLAAAAATLAGWLLAGSPAEDAVSTALADHRLPLCARAGTPAALMVACGRGAQAGIFVKRFQALEWSRAVDTVVLDKTRTVTTGVMTVTAAQPAAGTSRDILPPGVWEVVFALAAGWFAGQVVRARRGCGTGRWRCPHPVPHLAESLAMVYMLAAPRAPGSGITGAAMPGMGGAPGMAPFPVVAVILALFMVGYIAWLADRLLSISRPAAAAAKGEVAARGAAAASIWAAAGSTRGGAAGQQARPARGQPPAAKTGRRWPVLAPRAAAGYKIAMGITMAYMLIIMV